MGYRALSEFKAHESWRSGLLSTDFTSTKVLYPVEEQELKAAV